MSLKSNLGYLMVYLHVRFQRTSDAAPISNTVTDSFDFVKINPSLVLAIKTLPFLLVSSSHLVFYKQN